MTDKPQLPVGLKLALDLGPLALSVGGFMAALKSFAQGEISELTEVIHDARDQAIGRLKREADQLGAEEVVGVKTYIAELGSHLVEILAVGTAVKKQAGMAVKTANLPAQAIIRDRDTWMQGAFGFRRLVLRPR